MPFFLDIKSEVLLKFQRVGYLAVVVPSVENFITWIVSDHFGGTKLVFELDFWVPFSTGGCVIGIIDGCYWITVAIDHVNNTATNKRISHAIHRLWRNAMVCLQCFQCQGVKLRDTQQATRIWVGIHNP